MNELISVTLDMSTMYTTGAFCHSHFCGHCFATFAVCGTVSTWTMATQGAEKSAGASASLRQIQIIQSIAVIFHVTLQFCLSCIAIVRRGRGVSVFDLRY